MYQKRLKKLKLCEWTLIAVMIAVLTMLFHNSFITKSSTSQIIESIMIIGCTVSILKIRKTKSKLEMKIGLLKAYGERCGFNPIMLINFGLGILFLILAFLNLNDVNDFIFKLTVGLCCIVVGIDKRLIYYIQITDRDVIKLNLDFLKIRDIELVTFSTNEIVLKTTKRTMEISYAGIKTDEKQQILNDFEEMKLKGNMA